MTHESPSSNEGPSPGHGAVVLGVIVVMRTRQQGLGALSAFRRLVLPNLGAALVGRLWIVEDDRVRVHGGNA